MFKVLVILLIGSLNLPRATPCVAQYGQCGGIQYTGSKDCCSPYTCQYNNDYYSQCLTGTTAATKTASSSSTIRPSSGCNTLYSQCGGQNWSGSTCCSASICTFINVYYSQCLSASISSSTATTKASSTTTRSTIKSTSTTKATATASTSAQTTVKSTTAQTTVKSTTPTASSSKATTPTASSTKASSSTTNTPIQGCSVAYNQCGGIGWTGPTVCCSGLTCTFGNNYYSQCIPTPGASTSSSSIAAPIVSSSVNDGRQNGVTTRYWDCCKASCAWTGKATVTNPVKTCAHDVITSVDVNAQSGCNGGTAYMCNNQQPWNVSSSLSYGYAAVYVSGQHESDWCCACYSLVFTSGLVVGKELIVQATNTGGDLGNNHFDLQMPGGGVGIFDGCSSQFTGSYSWGNRYGGVIQRSDCNNLPAAIQGGCFWRFDWFMNADNPTMRFKQVTCPTVLTANTECVRK